MSIEGSPVPGARLADAREAVPTSVAKAFSLIETLATAPEPVRLNELARATGMTKPTAHRLLRALTVVGYVRPVGSGQYAVGPALISVASAALGGLKERPLIHRTLNEVHARTGLTVSYAMRWDRSVVVIDNVEPDQAYRISPRLGVRIALSQSAAGLAILAADDSPATDAVVAEAAVSEAVSEALSAARTTGYAVDTTQPGVCAVAAPVRFGGPLAGALMVTGLTFTMPPESIAAIGPVLVEQAQVLEATVRATLPPLADSAEETA